MKIVGLDEIRKTVSPGLAIAAMREAVLAQSRGECETPMPMHLALVAQEPGLPSGEVHIKSSYRRGGRYLALKMAGTFALRANGLVMLVSAEDGETVALLDDGGFLTDLRTAAVSALAARELGRSDRILGILGNGIQAGLTAELHAEVLPLDEIVIWGRSRERAEARGKEIAARLQQLRVSIAASPAEVAARARLIVTATAARAPLLGAGDLQAGTHVSAVGSDSPGKQELDPEILRQCSLLLVDSRAQCERLGELQHALSESPRAVELGAFCDAPVPFDREGFTVADFTGLGVEDLYIAEACFGRLP